MLSIGFHAKISKGLGQCLQDAVDCGANAVQIFTKSNRQFLAPLPSDEKVLGFEQMRAKLNFDNIFVHAGYLINLAGNDLIASQSYDSLLLELELCAIYKIKYLVLHPGSAGTLNWQEACIRVGQALTKAIGQAQERFGDNCPQVLLENMAGQGTVLGSNFEQLSLIAQTANNNCVGFCIDTAHLFGSGWNLQDKKVVADLNETIEKTITWAKVKLVHLNDSKEDCGSNKDRHEHWPNGKIGLKGLESFLSVKPKIIPMILETPVEKDYSQQVREIKLIKRLFL